MTTTTKPTQGQNVLAILANPRSVGGYIFRMIDAFYDAANSPTAPWVTLDGNLTDAQVSGWQAIDAPFRGRFTT